MKQHKKKIIIGSIVFICLYLILGAILPYTNQPTISSQTIEKVSSTTFTNNQTSPERAKIIDQNGEALQERIRLISQAKEEIILSTYEFRSDKSGKDILAALIDASQRGVQVQVLVDGIGALTKMTNNHYFIALSSLDNAQIKVYNPINLLKPWNLMARMHDKYLIVDNQSYILGGRNNYDYFLGDHNGYKNYDWDVLVYSSQKESHSIKQLHDYFDDVWNLPYAHLYHDYPQEQYKQHIIETRNELNTRYQNMQKENKDWFQEIEYQNITLPTNHIELVSNPLENHIKEPIVYYTITELMAQSKQDVRFHTPYIIADNYMMERMKSICQNVKDVTMMTNSVANNGNPFGAMEYQRYKDEILETGINILEYDGGISYHGKCFTIDDHLSSIGSFNWDMRSTYINTELVVVIDSQEMNNSLKKKMKAYEKDALKVIDKDHYDLQENQIPQEIGTFRSIQLFLMQLLIGWLRFLM